jgi:hypothetical protein
MVPVDSDSGDMLNILGFKLLSRRRRGRGGPAPGPGRGSLSAGHGPGAARAGLPSTPAALAGRPG